MQIQLTVNGNPHTVDIQNNEVTLLSYLRNELRLTATKNGCGEGHCGACMVIIDGKACPSCRRKLIDLNNSTIETTESLRTAGEVHVLICAFVTEGAVQCGFCTPGFIMAAKALLDSTHDPTEAEIKKAFTAAPV